MCLRINTDIQVPAVTLVKREAFLRTVSDIILYSIVKSLRKIVFRVYIKE